MSSMSRGEQESFEKDDLSPLSSLPDINKMNTSNVKDMSYMFCGCCELSSLPDISTWNTENVTNMRYIFYKVYKLSSLPDISKWNTENVIDMSFMFSRCSLHSLPYQNGILQM